MTSQPNPMKTSHTILLELLPGQTSTDVLAEKLRQPARILAAYLQDLEVDGLVERGTINATVTIWKITRDGRDLAASLQTPATL